MATLLTGLNQLKMFPITLDCIKCPKCEEKITVQQLIKLLEISLIRITESELLISLTNL